MNTKDLQHKPLVLRTDDTFQRKHVKEPGKFWKSLWTDETKVNQDDKKNMK